MNDRYAKYACDCFPYVANIDIEGSEADLFSARTESVEATPLVIIELHDWLLTRKSVSPNLPFCIAQLDRDFVHIGDNVFSIERPDALDVGGPAVLVLTTSERRAGA